jgi:16S rRNA C967 or C1407 C5-methylase (RsmB/RsmF family)/NOL1/NOP2/fmu family ribosome biogenesis protein
MSEIGSVGATCDAQVDAIRKSCIPVIYLYALCVHLLNSSPYQSIFEHHRLNLQMQLPQSLLHSLQGVTGFDEKSFVQVHESGEQVTSIRLNPIKAAANDQLVNHFSFPVNSAAKVPWSSYGYYLAERPSFTFDPLFHAGVYYVQEASSMFLEQALRQTVDLTKPLKILDLCAAPGGKSTLIQSLIGSDSLLVTNEVIKSRAAVLEENIIKWGAANVVVTNNDPHSFAKLEHFFDVVVIDAPCSGSGLFRRDPGAIDEWSENNVQLCSQRQQRILADVWPALKENGILIYSTCSYSQEEDEDILDWLADQFAVHSLSLSVNKEWGITESFSPKHKAVGYRFYPGKVRGEGLFMAVLQKKDGGEFAGIKSKKSHVEKAGKVVKEMVQPWLIEGDYIFFQQNDDIVALPGSLQQHIPVLQSALYIKKAGITIGKPAGRDLLPDHQLALSNIIAPDIVSVTLNKEEAIRYLRREDIMPDTNHRGWALVKYEGYNLGWVKILPNRVNNYYPKEWRILKTI